MTFLWITAGAVFFAIAAELIRSNTALGTKQYRVTNDKIPTTFDGYRIVLLSDLHGKSFGHNNARLIGKVIEQNPDLIVMAGDMLDKHQAEFASFFSLIDALVPVCPIVFGYGNHEIRLNKETLSLIETEMRRRGVIICNDTRQIIERAGENILLYGLCVPLSFYKGINRAYDAASVCDADAIQNKFGTADTLQFNMLIAHCPTLFGSYAEWGADLVFSGHMHGGLVRLPFVGGVLSPEIAFFPKYDAGVFLNGRSTMILSRGLGNGRLKFRFCNQGSVDIIVLKNGKFDAK